MTEQKVSRKLWVGLGVVAGIIVGGIIGLAVGYVIAISSIGSGAARHIEVVAAVIIMNFVIPSGVIGAVVGAITGGIVVNRRLRRQPHPEAQTVATSPFSPSIPNKRLIMLIAAGVIGTVTPITLYQQQLTIWDPINSALVGLVIYEILYQTRQWLSLKTLVIYVIVATLVSSWLYALLWGVEFSYYEYLFSLEPLTYLFSVAGLPFNLYLFIETAIVTGVAYWLICIYQKSVQLRQPRPETQTVAADDHHSPGGDEVEE